jgi:hypothetical protein
MMKKALQASQDLLAAAFLETQDVRGPQETMLEDALNDFPVA